MQNIRRFGSRFYGATGSIFLPPIQLQQQVGGSRRSLKIPSSKTHRRSRPIKTKHVKEEEKKALEDMPTFKGYLETLKEIMHMPLTTADPEIPARRVTADYCARHFKTPPRNVTMLTRDFISDSLYNPAYGYFSKQALIFSPQKGYNFGEFRDSADFLSTMGRQYEEIEQELDDVRSIPRQLWHTPTEILKPWYGYSVARHIAQQYAEDRKNGVHNGPLVIYEVGGGNGTLMLNILDYLREYEPDMYNQTEYNLIEISPKLARQQLSRHASSSTLHGNARIINQSILDWDKHENRPCFVVAMEVIDNLAHDVVRYDYQTDTPYQALVHVFDDGEFEEIYEQVYDPLIREYLATRAQAAKKYRSPAQSSRLYRKLRSQLPLAPNLTRAEFVPTHAFRFVQVLGKHFPRHRIVLSDFYKLPDTVPNAVSAPVVQTRFDGTMVPCTTYLVQPGWFDIFFPTDFELLLQMYNHMCRTGASAPLGPARVCSQREFARKYAELPKTATRSGENPMLDFYENNKFLLS
ncbi:S-adenosyl-L-methionine-dependent methyltransferase [Coemansia mojavensis]|nr:S-adenosyl-L-methionine-dependent methyltransferase [Coemansia mojavensis]